MKRLPNLWRADFLSPKYLFRYALLLVSLYLIVTAAGLREFTSILNGTTGSLNMGWEMSVFLGFIYIFLYLGFVLLAPILLLASGLLWLWQRIFRPAVAPSRSSDESRTNTAVQDPLRHFALHNRSRD